MVALVLGVAAVFALIGFATGCGPDDSASSLPARVYTATLDAWYARNDLPPIRDRGTYCGHLEAFEMRAPATLAEYLRTCPAKSAACLDWAPMRGARTRLYPVAVIHPEQPAERWARLGVHEICHALQRCREGSRGDQDVAHVDPRVWRGLAAAPRLDSVEAQARMALGEPPGPLIAGAQ